VIHFNKRSKTKAEISSLGSRVAVAAGGAVAMLTGIASLQRGFLAYRSLYGQTVFAGAAISSGILLIALSLIPSTWISRMIAGKLPVKAQHVSNRSRKK
jgi:hypothetical protein